MAIPDGKHVIHAGGVFPNPLLNAEGNAVADTLPGTIVVHVPTGLGKAAGTEEKIFYVADLGYITARNVEQPNLAGENMIAIQPLPGMFLNVRSSTGQAYVKGDAITFDAAGRVKKYVDTGRIAGYAEETVTTIADDQLVRVVIK